MNVTLKQLRAFVAVAKTRSFTEACARLHLSQPALSIAIRNLEEVLGGALLVRTTRNIALTPEGEVFLPKAQRLLADMDNTFDEMHNRFALFKGKITLASMPSFAANQLPEAIKAFRATYPHINVTLNDVVAEDVIDMVRNGQVEIGVSFDPGESEDLSFDPLFNDRFIAILPQDHELAQRDTITWKPLLDNDFISLQRPSSIRLLIENMLAKEQLIFTPALETHHLVTIGRMVSIGLGVSVVPALCQSQMEELGAVCRPLEDPVIDRPVGIITRQRYPLSAAAKAMIGSIKQLNTD